MNLSGISVAILVEQQYQEMEVWYPHYRLLEAGVRSVFVGPEAGKSYPSKLGYPAKAEMSIDQARAEDFDGVILPGGFAPDFLRRNPRMILFTQAMADQGKVLAAICHGPWMLCSTNALKGKKATCFFAIKDDVINAGANYVDAEVVRDGQVITSRTPDDLPAFMKTFMAALAEAKR